MLTASSSVRPTGCIVHSLGPTDARVPPLSLAARIWQVLALMHHGLDQGTTSTKRELFYADPGLFGSQTAVDRARTASLDGTR